MKVIRRRNGEVEKVLRYAPLETRTEEIMQDALAILRQIDRKAARIRKLAWRDREDWSCSSEWAEHESNDRRFF